jgi:Ca2+-binding RTX toxin-like protein
VNLQFDGTLLVTGDLNKLGHPRSDRIVVLQDLFDVSVVQNGETFGPFSSFDINLIQVEGGGGSDKILSSNADGSSAVDIPEVLIGGTGNDTIEGGSNGDTVSGGGGKDLLAGGFGGDEIYGGPGDDRLNGATFIVQDIGEFDDAGDLLDGGSGHDIADYSTRLESLFVSNDNVADDGIFGADFFTGELSSQENDNVLATCEDIYGGAGNDALAGAGGDTYIDGGAGDDALFGENGNDTVVGGKGDDTLCGGTGADQLFGGPGTDFLLGDYRFLRESDFAPVFDFFPGPFLGDTLDGGDGDDFIRGGGDNFFPEQSGDDSMIGGLGTDFLFGDDGNDIIKGGAGEDLLEGDVGDDSLFGGNDDDLLLNQSAFLGITDKDFVDGGDGFDIGQADPNNDRQPIPETVEFFIDLLDTPSGGSPLSASNSSIPAVDTTELRSVFTAAQSQAPGRVRSTTGLTASAAPKVVSVVGTGKNDAISITERDGIISVYVNGAITTYASGTVKRFSVEVGKGNDYISFQTSKGTNICTVPCSVLGASGDDTIIGGSKRDTIYGGAGNDVIAGGKGGDSLFGNEGNDKLDGGADNDILNGGSPDIPTADGTDDLIGGAGEDSVDYKSRTDNLTITMNDNVANDGAVGEKDNVHNDIEDIFTGSGKDKVTGTIASNIIATSGGNDTITGLDGNDKLLPGAGDDSVTGGAGRDLYVMVDNTRDDFDAPVNDLTFQISEFVAGDELKDYSFLSQRFIGRSAPKQSSTSAV